MNLDGLLRKLIPLLDEPYRTDRPIFDQEISNTNTSPHIIYEEWGIHYILPRTSPDLVQQGNTAWPKTELIMTFGFLCDEDVYRDSLSLNINLYRNDKKRTILIGNVNLVSIDMIHFSMMRIGRNFYNCYLDCDKIDFPVHTNDIDHPCLIDMNIYPRNIMISLEDLKNYLKAVELSWIDQNDSTDVFENIDYVKPFQLDSPENRVPEYISDIIDSDDNKAHIWFVQNNEVVKYETILLSSLPDKITPIGIYLSGEAYRVLGLNENHYPQDDTIEPLTDPDYNNHLTVYLQDNITDSDDCKQSFEIIILISSSTCSSGPGWYLEFNIFDFDIVNTRIAPPINIPVLTLASILVIIIENLFSVTLIITNQGDSIVLTHPITGESIQVAFILCPCEPDQIWSYSENACVPR